MEYYEKLYKQALENAKRLYEQGTITESLAYIFPELKESEDEKIRGSIIDHLKDNNLIEWAAWLEKQESVREVVERCKNSWYNEGKIAGMAEGLTNDEKYQQGWHDALEKQCQTFTKKDVDDAYLKGVCDAKHELEKQDEPQDKGEISDGYHTFNELYYYRMLYNAAFFNMLPKEWVHKSKRHNDGEECFGGGWFIVMANLPTGQISNHYELKDWDLFQIPEKEVADKWDGHTPQEAADRLHKYLLEKQGNEPAWCHHKADLSDCTEEYRKAYYDGWNNCNQQHSQCDADKNDVIKCLINGMRFYYEDNKDATWGTDKWSMPVKHIIEVLEKQGEQKPAVVDFNAKDWYVSKVDGKIHDMTYNPADKVEPKFKVKYAGSEYNVLEVKDIAGVTFYGIEDEPNHIDYVKAENCEIISGYAIKENGSPYPTKPAAWSEEDEKMYKIALSCIETLEDITNGKNMHADVKKWLKSIKDRIGG